jgi:hypothetical protein
MSVILVSVLEISWKRQGEVKGGYTSQATSLIALRIGVLEEIKVNKWGLCSCIIKLTAVGAKPTRLFVVSYTE